MYKVIKVLLIVGLIVALVCAISRHAACRLLICRATSQATGLELSIEDLNLDILNSSLYIRGITLFNPPGFKNEVLGKGKEIFIKYNLSDFLKGRVRLREVKAELSEINIIRSERGETNIASFKEKKNKTIPLKKIAAPLPAAQRPVQEKKIPAQSRSRFFIDRLELSLEQATYIDYQAGIGQPAVIIFTLNGPLIFRNVSDLNEVAKCLSAKGGFRGLLGTLEEK